METTVTKTKNEEIGGRLRRLRGKRGLSMRVAYLIRETYGVKIDPSYLSRIERGRVELPLRTLMAFADYYDVSPAWLLDGDPAAGVPAGLEYIYSSPELVNGLNELRDTVGEDQAKQYMKTLLEHIVNIVGEPVLEANQLMPRVEAQAG